MILAEAYRTISGTEGGETHQMQVNRAVFRVLTAEAPGGDRLALQRWTRLVREAGATCGAAPDLQCVGAQARLPHPRCFVR